MNGTAFRLAFLCCSGTLSDTTQPLLQDTYLEGSSSPTRYTAYSEDNGTKVMAFPLHCSNEKESDTSGTLMHCFWQGGKREKRIGAKSTRKRAHLLLGSGAR
jgi:hypothetical protein